MSSYSYLKLAKEKDNYCKTLRIALCTIVAEGFSFRSKYVKKEEKLQQALIHQYATSVLERGS